MPRTNVGQAGVAEKLAAARGILSTFERVVVAFSGGVDSTLLGALARDVLGKHGVLAVTADSPSMARQDVADATGLAAALDVEHLVVPTHETQDAAYRANTPSRCYLCKGELFTRLDVVAAERGIGHVLYGAISDDLAEALPGAGAAREHHVRAPLQEAGFSKAEVREAARLRGLPNWDRPQNACLASRIPHGLPVTEERLGQIEVAEAFLRSRGFRQVRVRHLGDRARIEVEPEAVARFRNDELLAETVERLQACGFQEIQIDPRGYRRGGADQ